MWQSHCAMWLSDFAAMAEWLRPFRISPDHTVCTYTPVRFLQLLGWRWAWIVTRIYLLTYDVYDYDNYDDKMATTSWQRRQCWFWSSEGEGKAVMPVYMRVIKWARKNSWLAGSWDMSDIGNTGSITWMLWIARVTWMSWVKYRREDKGHHIRYGSLERITVSNTIIQLIKTVRE